VNYLPGLGSNSNPPDLCLRVARITGLSHPHLAYTGVFFNDKFHERDIVFSNGILFCLYDLVFKLGHYWGLWDLGGGRHLDLSP
jgi:hypothetical protein